MHVRTSLCGVVVVVVVVVAVVVRAYSGADPDPQDGVNDQINYFY